MTEVDLASEPRVSLETLEHLGEGHIAYVKQIRSEDVPGLFPQVRENIVARDTSVADHLDRREGEAVGLFGHRGR